MISRNEPQIVTSLANIESIARTSPKLDDDKISMAVKIFIEYKVKTT